MFGFVIISLFGMLFITGCSSQKITIYNRTDEDVGSIRIESEEDAEILNAGGKVAGRVKGLILRDHNDGRIGRIVTSTEGSDVYDKEGSLLMSLKDDVNCEDSEGNQIGRIGMVTDPEAAAGGCYIMLVLNRK